MQARPVKRKLLDRKIFRYFRSVSLQLIQVRIDVGTASALAEAYPLHNRSYSIDRT